MSESDLRRAKRAYKQGLFDRTTISDASLSPGQDDGTTISAGNTGELVEAQVGQDGELVEYEAVIVGQPPFSTGQTTRAKPTVDIQNSTPADVPAGTQFAFAGRKPGTREGKRATGWYNEDDYSDTAKSDRDPVEPTTPFILADQYLTVWGQNQQTSFTPSASDSTYELKALAWNGEGL